LNTLEFFRSKAKYFLVVSATFFVYQFYLLLNSFSAVGRIYDIIFHGASAPSFWSVFWFASEIIGEIGLLVRFSGACFLFYFLLVLVIKKKTLLSWLRKAILLEGAYYLFMLPFIAYLFARPYGTSQAQLVGLEAALSYTLQMLLISPVFFVLFTKLRQLNLNSIKVAKWGAIAVIGFVFALWVKHFMLNIYALPIDFSNGVLAVGFFNSVLTMLAAVVLLTIALWPAIREKSPNLSYRIAGMSLVLVGFYFVVYIIVAFFNKTYMSFLELTEIWAISMFVAGLGLILERKVET
jgi:hypothetical protein